MAYKYGDFTFFKDMMSKSIMEPTFTVLTDKDFDFLKNYNPPKDYGFMFTQKETKPLKLIEIERKICDAYSGHSGASFGWTMRQLEFISKEGWNNYVKLCT